MKFLEILRNPNEIFYTNMPLAKCLFVSRENALRVYNAYLVERFKFKH